MSTSLSYHRNDPNSWEGGPSEVVSTRPGAPETFGPIQLVMILEAIAMTITAGEHSPEFRRGALTVIRGFCKASGIRGVADQDLEPPADGSDDRIRKANERIRELEAQLVQHRERYRSVAESNRQLRIQNEEWRELVSDLEQALRLLVTAPAEEMWTLAQSNDDAGNKRSFVYSPKSIDAVRKWVSRYMHAVENLPALKALKERMRQHAAAGKQQGELFAAAGPRQLPGPTTNRPNSW